ncbi:MAG: glycosyltransferase [Clostridia bacterium]|nr:glycosyltransferase [Clostridia bacterium]
MRMVLVTLGSFGDISPFIWMGKTLAKQGNEIVFLANPYFEKNIANEGFDFRPIGTVEDYRTATTPFIPTGNKFSDKGKRINASRRLFNYMFLKPVKVTYEIISELKSKDMLILNHFYAYGAKLAAEKHGLRNININLSPYWLKTFKKVGSLSSFFENKMTKLTNSFIDKQLFNKPINNLRKEIGLQPLQKSSIEWMFNGMNLSLYPGWFQDFKLSDGIKIDFIGFPEHHEEKVLLPHDIRVFLQKYEKPIVFTPGTAFENNKKFFSEAVLALEKLGKPGIFLTRFKESLPQKLPDNIIYMEFVPLDALLDKCSILVHHGGIGTSYQALKAGIPQIICYRMGEQKENARVLEAAGVCTSLFFDKIDSNLLIKNIKNLIYNNNVPLKCNEIKNKLKSPSSEQLLKDIL